jgi:Cu(I)/Ag(I) efflux system membrane fusion protein
VEVSLEAFPGEAFRGSIMFIDPFLDDATRTIRVRVNIPNHERRLKPQMFATASIHVKLLSDGSPEPTGLEGKFICPMHPEVVRDEAGKCSICEMPLDQVAGTRGAGRGAREELAGHEHPQATSPGTLAIPVSAVLDTGRRRITYRLTNAGAYELVELKLGPRAHAIEEPGGRREFFVVLDGLNPDDQVVTQSGFLLDSQRQIEGMPSLIFPEGQTGTAIHAGHGRAKTSPSIKDMPSGHKH